jgi:hypothetical protein
MAFRDLGELVTVKPLIVPIRGKKYELPGDISAASWVRLQLLFEQVRDAAAGVESDPAAGALSAAEERAIRAEMFGPAEAEMVADGCLGSEVDAVYRMLWAYYMNDRSHEVAEAYWNAQGEAPAPSPEPKKPRARGSRAGSTNRRKAQPSAGETSSSAGT